MTALCEMFCADELKRDLDSIGKLSTSRQLWAWTLLMIMKMMGADFSEREDEEDREGQWR